MLLGSDDLPQTCPVRKDKYNSKIMKYKVDVDDESEDYDHEEEKEQEKTVGTAAWLMHTSKLTAALSLLIEPLLFRACLKTVNLYHVLAQGATNVKFSRLGVERIESDEDADPAKGKGRGKGAVEITAFKQDPMGFH